MNVVKESCQRHHGEASAKRVTDNLPNRARAKYDPNFVNIRHLSLWCSMTVVNESCQRHHDEASAKRITDNLPNGARIKYRKNFANIKH